MNANTVEIIQKLAQAELSLPARLGYVALLLVATLATVGVVSLWVTEPLLPLRTQLAFAAMSVIGLSWAALSIWALATRRVLFARDRVIAGWMAAGFTSMFLIGAGVAVLVSGGAAAWVALATGAIMLAVAVRVLSGARRRFAALSARRVELERILEGVAL